MAIRLYGVLLALFASISLAVFPVISRKSDPISFSIARRLLFVLGGMTTQAYDELTSSWRCAARSCSGIAHWGESFVGCEELE